MILSGVLFNACGPMPDTRIKFEAQRTTMNGVVYSAECYFTTQEDGSYYIELEPGFYTVSWIERGRPVRLGSIVADMGSEMSLPEALEADFTPAEPSYIEDALGQMQAALVEAKEAASTAAADVSDMLTQAVAESADRAEQEADRARDEADRANTYADNAGYVTRERLRKQATLDLDFASGDYAVDTGEKLRTTNAQEVLTVERATPKWVFGPNGKLREVPPNTIARQWNPETGEPEGALIEESRTNLLLWSEDFTQGAWSVRRATLQPTSEASSYGSSYQKMAQVSGTGNGHITQEIPTNGPSIWTAFYVVKAAEFTSARIEVTHIGESDGVTSGIYFNLLDGAHGETAGRIFRASSTALPCGGFLISVSWTTELAKATQASLQTRDAGDGTSGILVAAAQLEQGSTPSSYIPTEDAPVTRAADNVSRELGEEFNPSAFTVVLRGLVSDGAADTGQRLLSINGGTHTQRLSITRTSLITTLAGSSVVTQRNDIPNDANIALSWDSTTLTIYVNGTEWYSGERYINPALFSQMQIGKDPTLGVRGATYSFVSILPMALTEQELIELTS